MLGNEYIYSFLISLLFVEINIMYPRIFSFLLLFLILINFSIAAEPTVIKNELIYNNTLQNVVPIPPSERNLQTAIAKPWFQVDKSNIGLEGIIFDKQGNLLFCDVTNRRILKLSPDKKITTILTLENFSPGGLALNKDGRLFIAALNLEQGLGEIISVNQDGSDLKTIISDKKGYLPNDIIFHPKGGFYFTDFRGNATSPKGGIYYVTDDFKTITPVLLKIAMANGITFDPKQNIVWATEFARNALYRLELSDKTTIAPVGSNISYYFTGPAPDSMRIDVDGNVYVAIYGQGRVLIFNNKGIPIGQILLPQREGGYNLRSTSLAINPLSKDIYIVSSDEKNKYGATIFHAKAFNHGL